MRSCVLAAPDYKVIVEACLYCSGFQQCQTLADKLIVFFELIKTQVWTLVSGLHLLVMMMQ